MPANACRWMERKSVFLHPILQVSVELICLGDASW